VDDVADLIEHLQPLISSLQLDKVLAHQPIRLQKGGIFGEPFFGLRRGLDSIKPL
jgi:hypothetical protein